MPAGNSGLAQCGRTYKAFANLMCADALDNFHFAKV